MVRVLVTRYWPEIALVLAGCLLRTALAGAYEVRLGYDFYDHARNIAWWMQHFSLPPIDWSRAAYHPPLYYIITGALGRAGVGFVGMGLFSLLLGCIRLGLVAVGLVHYLPQQRLARLAGLALAAVLPASVHMDVMVTNEALTATLTTLALVLLPVAFSHPPGARWWASIGLGATLALAILTKVSALVVVAAVGATAVLSLLRDRPIQLRRQLPPLTAIAIALVGSGWYFAHCKATYGKAFVTGYDSWRSSGALVAADLPLLSRRPAGYLVGWNLDIYRFPFYPSAALAEARFFPQLVASTFSDYHDYGLAPYPPVGAPALKVRVRPLHPAVVRPAAVSVLCGTFIAVLTAAAWLGALVLCWRRRAHAMLGLLLVPALAIAGQAYFALSIANDAEGVIKGSYVQFAAAPLFALFGLAIGWCWQRRPLRAVVPLALVAVAGVAWYVVFCVFFAG